MSYSNINRVVLIGRLTRKPELRSLPSGTTVCTLRIASNATRKDPEGGYLDKPNYFNVTVFGGPAETIHRHTYKGSRVAIDGHLEWSEWETAEGVKRQSVGIIADRVQFLEARSAREGDDEEQSETPTEGSGIPDEVTF